MRAHALALASLFACGCYLSHGRDAQPDARVPAPRADAGAPLDAGADGGPDVEVVCRLTRLGEAVVRDPRTHSAQAPDAVWTGDALAIAMMEGGGDTSHPLVTMVELAPDLSRVGEPRTIGEEAHGWGELDLAAGGLTLCWHGDPGGPGRTMLRQVLEDGRLGPRRDHDRAGEACLDLVAMGDRALVAWRRRVEVEGGFAIETHAQLIAPDGAPMGDSLWLATAPYPGRSIDLFAGHGSFFAALSPSDSTVRVLEIARDGRVSREVELLLSDARGAAIAATEDRVALLVGMGPPEVRSLALLVLDRALRPLGEPRVLSDGAPTTLSASIEPAPDGWIVAWADGHQPSTSVTLLHLDPDGLAREPRVRVHQGSNSGYGGPSMTRHEDELYLALSRSDESGHEGVIAQRWRCERSEPDACAPIEIVEGDCDADEPAAWRWTGTHCAPVSCPSACAGEGCDRLAPSRFACLADHAGCAVSTCDGRLAPSLIDRACVASTSVREGDPLRVTVSRDVECPCGASLACAARVEGPFALVLEAALCAPPVDCDCGPGIVETLSATCELPPLSAGMWQVRAEGGVRLALEVVPPWHTAPSTPACSRD